MTLSECTYSVLLVSAAAKFNASFLSVLSSSGIRFLSPVTAASVAEAREHLAECMYDIAVINTPLPDDAGISLAEDICRAGGTAVLLLVREEHYAAAFEKVTPHGVLTLPKPTTSVAVTQALGLLAGVRERLRRMEVKNTTMEEKMQEIRLVNRAKWVLIDRLKMTEQDAHRYIEKTAMDRCLTRRAVAENILKTYL